MKRMVYQGNLLSKTLVIVTLILFIGMSVVTSTGNIVEDVSANYSPLESTDSSRELSTCGHLVYFGEHTDEPFECWLYEGTLNDIDNSTCICIDTGGSGIVISGSTWTNDAKLIGCEYGNGRLYEINPETCEMQSIGSSGVHCNGLAWDPVYNKLYGTTGTQLVEYDPDTGEQDVIGSHYMSSGMTMIAMACDANGSLYGWDVKFGGESYLYEIDTGTGEATIVGGMGMTLCYAQDGDFCKIDDILYLAAYTKSSQSLLCKCDKETGELTILGSLGNAEFTIFSIPWNFRPFIPSNPIPSDGATNVSIYVSLCWMGGDPDGDLVTYDVYYGTTYPPPQVASNVTEYNPGILDFNMTYYWKLVAWDEHGAYTEGPIWCFITGVNHPPDDPQIAGPTRGKPGEEYIFYFLAIDPEGDNISYYIEWEDGTSTGWTPYIQSGLDIGFYHIWNKIDDYYVRCKAKDIHGAESDWSVQSMKISKNEPFNFNFKLLERFLNRSHLLEVFLRAMNLLR